MPEVSHSGALGKKLTPKVLAHYDVIKMWDAFVQILTLAFLTLFYSKSSFQSLADLKHSIQQRQLNETTGSCACTLPHKVSLYIQQESKFTAGNQTSQQIESVIIITSNIFRVS